MFEKEIIQLYTPEVSYGFIFVAGRLFSPPKCFYNWYGYSYEKFAQAVINEFGYCWKMVFRSFNGKKWIRTGYSSVNW